MKEKELNAKNDKPDIKNKYYELGWFSTKINKVEINGLQDICNWIEAMCELAEKGSKRQLWGTKKKDDRGMLGILKVCDDNNFKTLKKLPHGMFDCVPLLNLLDKINICVRKANTGRTRRLGFLKTLGNCKKVLRETMETICDTAVQIKNFGEILNGQSEVFYEFCCCVFKFGDPEKKLDINNYKKYVKYINIIFKEIINEKKIKVNVGNQVKLLTSAKNSVSYLCEYKNYWINEKVLDDPLAKDLQTNLEKIKQGLENNLIILE